MNDFKILRKSLPRLDALDKVSGNYQYGMDLKIEGALESFVLRSPYPHARILSIDIMHASRMKGVEAILIGQDFSDLRLPGVIDDQPILAIDRVRFFGEPVAVVAATSLEEAADAAKSIVVEYDPLPLVDDPEEAMLPDAYILHENWETYKAEHEVVRSGNIACHAQLQKGNVDTGFAESDYIFEDIFTTSSVHQAHLEPRVATAVMDENGLITVYTNTQLPYWIRTNVASVLGLPEESVRIVPTGMGGGFGSKLYPQIEPFVALLAQKTGKAVRMVVPLQDELKAGLPRHPSKTYIKTGVRKDGTIVARQARLVFDTGAYAGSGPEIASVGVLILAGPYRIENIKIDVYAVMTNKMNFGAYRGPGGPQSIFALESHMDSIASKIGLDPLQFRLANIVQEGDEAANGQILEGVGLREAMEKASAAIEWDNPTIPNRGKGLAIGWWTTTGGKSTGHVALEEDGKIAVSVGTQEIGTGAIMGGVPQVVAEMMGVDLEDIRLKVTDTSEGLWDFGSQGSRTLFNVGRVAQFAARDLIVKMKNLAAQKLEVEVSELVLRDKAVIVRESPDQKVTFQQLAQLDSSRTLQSTAISEPSSASYDKNRLTSCLYPSFHYPSFHCHAAEVEVDPGTGEVRILQYAAAHDIGFAVNPALIKGQIHGGVAQGIGMALMEEIVYKGGIMVNNNWTDYKLPTIVDVPDIEAIIIEHPIPGGGPYGLKGLGESPVLEPPATLANAIAKAIGIRLHHLPMTPEKVLNALREKG